MFNFEDIRPGYNTIIINNCSALNPPHNFIKYLDFTVFWRPVKIKLLHEFLEVHAKYK